MVYKWSSFLLLPGICAVCRRPSHRDKDLCSRCEAALPTNNDCCQHCAEPLPQPVASCGRCQRQAPQFDRAVAPLIYRDAVIDMIHRFKYQRGRAYGQVLVDILADAISAGYQPSAMPALIAPVPMHWRRLLWRGGNHANNLSLSLSHRLGLKHQPLLFARKRYTHQQKTLNRRERLANLTGAFALQGDVHGKHIAIIDDVMTTGATADTLATLLKHHGAKQVDVWTAARTALS